jgi:23S rRNA (guanosine2251-2'-O)-methyltransferase
MASAGIGDRVEGFHAVSAALTAGRVIKISVESGRMRRNEYEALIERARSAGVAVEVVDDVRPLAETSAPQGVVAAARPIPPPTLEEAAARTTPAAVLVLDHLEDPRNVGAAARSALAAGITAMVVPTRRAAPVSGTAFKAAAGALEHVAVVEVSSMARAIEKLRGLGLWIVGLDGSAERSIFGHELLAEPVALVVGGEGAGLARLVAERCDTLVRIPMVGATESLNASIATAIAVFEVARVRGWV